MPDRDDNDGFLMRWSRRKRGDDEAIKADKSVVEAPAVLVEEEVSVASLDQRQVVEEVIPQEDAAADTTVVEEAPSDTEATPTDLENVDIGSLDYNSDYTRFMQEGVPEALKRRALRQLWRSDPILANIDGLNDYDGDFTDAALAVDVLKTIYKVGKGYLTDEDDDGDELDETDELEVAESEDAPQDSGGEEPGEATEAEPDEVAASSRDDLNDLQRDETDTATSEVAEESSDVKKAEA